MTSSTAIPPTSLPRSSALTAALVEQREADLAPDDLRAIRELFMQEVSALPRNHSIQEGIRIDRYRLSRSVLNREELDRRFEWNPRSARRPLGLESVRTWLASPNIAPSQAVRDTLLRFSQMGDRKNTVANWLSTLPLGARAVVEAETVLWTTQLRCALDWADLNRPIVGADRSVVVPGVRRITLRGQSDVAVQTQSTLPFKTLALFVMMPGRPGPSSRVELSFSVFVESLRQRLGAIPTRVVGWWPQCGRALAVSIDFDLLLQTTAAVIGAIRSEIGLAPHSLDNVGPSRQQPNVLDRVAS